MPSSSSIPRSFAPPKDGACDILLIAGEHSGDQQAARMLRALSKEDNTKRVCAFGGREMEAAGAQLLFDMTGFSVVGLFEVLKNYGFFKVLAERIVGWIEKYRPKTVCFVDYPGFNLHLAGLLKKRGISIKGGGNVRAIYYISPQIWAWKAGRRFKMAELLDSLAVIFPFETACYADTSLKAEFVGHPFLDPGHVSPVEYDASSPLLFLPGSRKAAVGRIFPIMLKTLRLLGKEKALVPYPSQTIKAVLEKILKKFPDLKYRVSLLDDTSSFPLRAKAALMSSGTMSLNCALAGIPAAIVYKANIFTYLAARPIVSISYLGISNILLNGSSLLEYIQFAARPAVLAKRMRYCMDNPKARAEALADANELKRILSAPNKTGAAGWLLKNANAALPR